MIYTLRASLTALDGFNASVDGGQRCAIIGDVDGEQACWLGHAGVLGDDMLAARRLEEALAYPVHLGRTGCGILRADYPRQHIDPDAAGVVMPRLPGARRIRDDEGGETVARQVRQLARGNCYDSLAGVAALGAHRREGGRRRQDGSGNDDFPEYRD